MQIHLFRKACRQPIVVSCGVGRDSVALLIEMKRRGMRPDAILFANTGSEKLDTYRYIPLLQSWLAAVEFPPLTVVRYEPKTAPYSSIEGNLILNATLPGAAFEIGSCTEKFKIEPQNRWTRRWAPAQEAWAGGLRVIKFIGFECDEVHRLKRADAKAHAGHRERFEVQYPLMDWGYGLEKCKQIIDEEGLPLPVKSACYFCPNQKKNEVRELSEEDRARIILMELTAEPYNQKRSGLWRAKSITEFILRERLAFTPLTHLGKKVVLNPACKKANVGYSFDPPHKTESLRALLQAAGHGVPEVIRHEDWDGDPDIYHEDFRETDAHLELVESL